MRKVLSLMFLALLLCGLSAGSAVFAAVQPLKVDPSRFIFETTPGQAVTGSITVINKGTEPAPLTAVLSDWTLDLDNRLVVSEEGTLPSSLSGMVKFNPRSFTLKPGGRQVVRFTIRIPREAKPTEFRGMIAFEQFVPSDETTTGAAIKATVTCTIYATVLPAVRKCETVRGEVVRDMEQGQTRLLLDVKGTGTAHFRGTGKFQVFRDGEKTPLARGDLGPMVVLPEVTTRFVGVCKGILPAGKYRVALAFEPEQPRVPVVEQSLSFVLN